MSESIGIAAFLNLQLDRSQDCIYVANLIPAHLQLLPGALESYTCLEAVSVITRNVKANELNVWLERSFAWRVHQILLECPTFRNRSLVKNLLKCYGRLQKFALHLV